MIRKDWNNFYTPLDVARHIVDLIPSEHAPTVAVDICAGSGNFLKAAIERWGGIKTIGIDILPTENIIQITKNIYKLDALDLERLNKIDFGKNKLILANPPFGKMVTNNIEIVVNSEKFTELHKEAIKSKRIEALMLISNLNILEKGDLFAAILPDNIFESENLRKFKLLFLNYFQILHSGETKEYFTKSEVKTRIFIGKYSGNSNADINFENVKPIQESNDLSVKVLRGIDNSKLLREIEEDQIFFDEVVHFSNDGGACTLKRYVRKNSKPSFLKISKNDILISRVGRNSGKIHKVVKDYEGKYLSDYFYLIKDFGKMASASQLKIMESSLLRKKRGLTASYLCKKDIMDEISIVIKEIKSKKK